MNEILSQISNCIEFGKIDRESKYPSSMINQNGAIELTKIALEMKIDVSEILNNGMLSGMKRVGEKFRDNKIYLPEVLIASKAMKAVMELLKPHFQSGEINYKGKIILGTVEGDLHDIGKNIVKMILEGGGWQVVDLGVNVSVEKFLLSVKDNSANIVGLSALLTTTMQNMEIITKELKDNFQDIQIIIGGAPVSQSFAEKINADKYFPDPQAMLDYLNSYSVN
jgi:5-methyltetrahydrofolate--homocysteine methyltransferase